jgi:formylglycine-generating enzyme required for sulfatase activity
MGLYQILLFGEIDLAYSEVLVENYLRHPAYGNYPVVGVSWLQANEYAKWRS